MRFSKIGIDVKLFFAWYDFWIGAYYDKDNRRLYLILIPMIVLSIQFGCKEMFSDELIESMADPKDLNCKTCVWAKACAALHVYGGKKKNNPDHPACFGTEKVFESAEG